MSDQAIQTSKASFLARISTLFGRAPKPERAAQQKRTENRPDGVTESDEILQLLGTLEAVANGSEKLTAEQVRTAAADALATIRYTVARAALLEQECLEFRAIRSFAADAWLRSQMQPAADGTQGEKVRPKLRLVYSRETSEALLPADPGQTIT